MAHARRAGIAEEGARRRRPAWVREGAPRCANGSLRRQTQAAVSRLRRGPRVAIDLGARRARHRGSPDSEASGHQRGYRREVTGTATYEGRNHVSDVACGSEEKDLLASRARCLLRADAEDDIAYPEQASPIGSLAIAGRLESHELRAQMRSQVRSAPYKNAHE